MDPIRQNIPRGYADQFINWIERSGGMGEYRDWVYEVERSCRKVHLDPCIVWVQGFVETNGFTSSHWLMGNSAGIGLIDGAGETPFDMRGNPDIGIMAAKLHVIWLYVALGVNRLPGYFRDLRHDNEEYKLLIAQHIEASTNNPERPPVRRLEDLTRRYRDKYRQMRTVWSWDKDYVNKLVSTAMFAPVQIPSIPSLHPHIYYDAPERMRVNREIPMYEGPSPRHNRRIDLGYPGQIITVAGETVGHVSRAGALWYFTTGPIVSYIRSSGADAL